MKQGILIFLSMILFTCTAFAADSQGAGDPFPAANQNTIPEDAKVNKTVSEVIEKYKAYARSVDPEIKEEVVAYRRAVAKLNREKRDLYQKLSSKAQEYLTQEQKFKNQLPIKHKRMMNRLLDEANKDKSSE